MQYRTQQDDVLDLICWNYYDRSDVFIDVLKANPGLCEQPVKLPAGLVIELPELTTATDEQIQVWSI